MNGSLFCLVSPYIILAGLLFVDNYSTVFLLMLKIEDSRSATDP
jgi:hypothetical protein